MNIQRLLICLCVSFLTSFSSFAQGKVWSVEKPESGLKKNVVLWSELYSGKCH